MLEFEDDFDLEDDDSKSEDPQVPEEYYSGAFVKDVEQFAREEMDRFFSKEELFCGGAIPKDMLNSQEYVTMVLNTDISHGVDAAYKVMQSESDVAVVNKILEKLSKSGVPKEFAGGILLIYLELVKGVDVDV